MLAYYCANNTNEYGIGIHKIINIRIPAPNITQTSLESLYDYVVIEDSLSSDIAGYPNKLVMDSTSSDVIFIREKTADEYLTDEKSIKISELKIYTNQQIYQVADNDKQASLLVAQSAGKDISSYTSWHSSMIYKYFYVKNLIINSADITTLNNIDFDTEFATEISNAPVISLNDYF